MILSLKQIFIIVLIFAPFMLSSVPTLGFGAYYNKIFLPACIFLVIAGGTKIDLKEIIEDISAWIIWGGITLILWAVYRHGFANYVVWAFTTILLTTLLYRFKAKSEINIRNIVFLLIFYTTLLAFFVFYSLDHWQMPQWMFGEGASGINRCRIIPCLSAVCVTLYSYYHQHFASAGKLLSAIARFALYLIAIAIGLSNSRESAVALLPIFIAATLLIKYGNHSKREKIFILLDAAVIVSIACAIMLLNGRWSQGVSNIQQFAAGNAQTSWGARLTMWIAAFHGWLQHPIMGWGNAAFLNMSADPSMTPYMPDFIRWKFNHFHSDYMTCLATGGIVLFTGLMGMHLYNLWHSWKHRNVARIVLVLSVMTTSLFDCAFVECQYLSLWSMLLYCLTFDQGEDRYPPAADVKELSA